MTGDTEWLALSSQRDTKDDAEAAAQTNPDGAICQSKEDSAYSGPKYQAHPRRDRSP
jgi:hypothetical protein